jgi:HEPN domain-containing protein
MSITEEERTNALGLFNSAECYREAADILASEYAKALSFDHPIRYHFYHAIELYLKAFLRTDLPLDKVESYGHGFRRLRGACTTRGLPLEQHEREVLTIIDTDKRYIRARYLVTGFSQEVAIKDLSWAAAAIAQKVGVQLQQRGLPIRPTEPSRFPRT